MTQVAWKLSAKAIYKGCKKAIFVPYKVFKEFMRQLCSIMGLLAFMGTIASGRLSDILERKYVLALIYFLRGVSFLVMAFASNLIMFYLGAIIFGIFWTATGPLTSALSSECWGLKNMGRTFGAVFLSHQIGASIGPILGGLTFDLTGSYFLIYILTAFILITGSFGVRGLKPTISASPPIIANSSM